MTTRKTSDQRAKRAAPIFAVMFEDIFLAARPTRASLYTRSLAKARFFSSAAEAASNCVGVESVVRIVVEPVIALPDWTQGTEAEARAFAADDRHYVARDCGDGIWVVWDCVSDHRVEFSRR